MSFPTLVSNTKARKVSMSNWEFQFFVQNIGSFLVRSFIKAIKQEKKSETKLKKEWPFERKSSCQSQGKTFWLRKTFY